MSDRSIETISLPARTRRSVLSTNGLPPLESGDRLSRGVLRSEVFPGLWLQPTAIWSNDLATMFAVLQRGLASPEHDTFVARLKSLTKMRRRAKK